MLPRTLILTENTRITTIYEIDSLTNESSMLTKIITASKLRTYINNTDLLK